MVGKTISHYKILEKIGEGGMGIVYKAEDLKLKRTIALKFLPPHALGSDDEKTRFLHEAQAAAAIEHPNIATVYEIDEVEEQIFIAMAYVEGESLKEKIEKGPVKLAETINLAIQIAEGLKEAHEKNVTHRDIKPANIMITAKGQVKILDFGLAKLSGKTRLTKENTTLGTTAYMSTEQAQGDEVDHRSDIWSLGVVLYEMISGQLPFKGDYEQAVIYSILNEKAEPVTGLRSGVSMALELILDKAMSKNPAERYQHAEDLLVDLRSVGKDLESGSGSSATIPLKATSKSRKPLYAGFGGLLLVAMVILYFLFLGTTPMIDSVAIMPFFNDSGNPDMEYLSDGITESLISKLSRLSDLKVMSRHSVFRFKGEKIDPGSVGHELNVRAVLLGRISQRDGNLKISLELIDTRDDRQLWGEQYNRKSEDLLALQEEISRQISEKLHLKLSPAENTQLAKFPTQNSEAYQLYLRGRYFLNRFSKEDLARSFDYFNQVIELDPDYALAYTGLADAYWRNTTFYTGSEEDAKKAESYAVKAIELDEGLPEAHLSIATIYFMRDWDWAEAEKEIRRALEINPNFSDAYSLLATILIVNGRFDDALQFHRKAVAIDPLHIPNNCDFGWAYYMARKYDQSIKQANRTLELPGAPLWEHIWIARSYSLQGMFEEALKTLENIKSKAENWPPWLAELAYVYASTDRKDEALGLIDRMLEISDNRYVNPQFIATSYAALGDVDRTFEWIENGILKRSIRAISLKVEPKFDFLRDDPRYRILLKKIGFDEK